MSELPILDETQLKVKNPQRCVWMLVRTVVDLLWRDNPKLHDVGTLVSSIKKYGFKPPPQYDATLDAIVDGNGRTEALWWMERNDDALPDGLAVHEPTSMWAMPVLIGNDAKSTALAEAYAIDCNNLTMLGGDFTAWDVSRMWDNTYKDRLKILADLDELPVSVDGDEMDALLTDVAKLTEGVGPTPEEMAEEISQMLDWTECPKCGHRWRKL